MLQLHQGSYLGKDLRVAYVLLLGLGTLALLATGLGVTSLWRSAPPGLGVRGTWEPRNGWPCQKARLS